MQIVAAAASTLKSSLIAVQALFPVLKEVEGHGQSSQLLEPGKLLNIPAGQLMQYDAPGGAYVPVEQMVAQPSPTRPPLHVGAIVGGLDGLGV